MTQTQTPEICTHSGRFHCDEVMATAMLEVCYDQELTICRTRDATKIKSHQYNYNSIVIDVGNIYNPAKLCFDHHQKSFKDTYGSNDILMSSCGLIWDEFAFDIISMVMRKTSKYFTNATTTGDVVASFYKNFVLSIDAGDNGVVDTDSKKRYNSIILPSTIASYNTETPFDDEKQKVAFRLAVNYCKTTLLVHLNKTITSAINNEENLVHFHNGLENTRTELINYGILVIDRHMEVNKYLNKFDIDQNFKFIIAKSPKNTFNIWTVNKKNKRFEPLMKIISEDKARELVGNNLIFVHKACFTGETRSQESAEEICIASVKQSDSKPMFSYNVVFIVGFIAISLYPFFN
jgi:uncharacterized UPF0160 family protein